MATVNLFHREVEANKSPRNAFDIGYSCLFTSPAGELLPCYVEEVNRGEKIKLGLSNVTRTRPLNTAAFMTFDEKVDFWFVPYKLIWSDYDNWRLAQNFRHRTTSLSEIGAQYLMPFCRYGDIAEFLRSFTTPISGENLYYNPNPADVVRLMDLLGYSVPLLNYKVTATPEDDGQRNLSLIKTTDVYSSTDVNNIINKIASYYDQISGVTPLNYFRLCAYQCIYMHSYRNEEFEELDPTYYNVDNVFNALIAVNTVSDGTPPTPISTNYKLVPTQPTTISGTDNRITLAKLFTPRFKNWRKDIFTAMKPESGFELGVSGFGFGGNEASLIDNPQAQYGSDFLWSPENPTPSDENTGYPDNSDLFNNLSTPNRRPEAWSQAYAFLNGNPSVVMAQLRTVVPSGSTVGSTTLYPQQIRNLLAQDRFTRSAIYADKDFSAQMKALFGEDVRDPHKPEYLGSYSSNVSISDVTATSAGSDGESNASTSILGQLAGKGYNGDGKGEVFSRTFDCDGIIMGIHYIMPRNNYDSNRIDRRNTKVSRWDYFYPQFDGLGLQPTFQFERGIPVPASGVDMDKISSVLGYSPRFYEYKQRVNEVHGAFMAGQSDYDWTLSNNAYDITSASDVYNFKILPTITNRIFGVEYNGSSATDHFQHYFEFNVTRVSNMEAYGTPSI